MATVTGVFSSLDVGGEFALAVLGAIPIGLAIGWLSAATRTRADDPRVVIIISVLTPYAAYLPADQIGASGILAVVIAYRRGAAGARRRPGGRQDPRSPEVSSVTLST